jgi:heterogeneous nuclear rnp K-like protein
MNCLVLSGLEDDEKETKATLRLLIAHQLAGSVIGKGGSKIKAVQESSHARVVISKDLLPQSTERVVEILGTPDQMYYLSNKVMQLCLKLAFS